MNPCPLRTRSCMASRWLLMSLLLGGASNLLRYSGDLPGGEGDRVPQRGERWRVGKIDVSEFRGGQAGPDRGRDDVDALGRAFVDADDLPAEQASAPAFGDELHADRGGVGHVTGLRRGRDGGGDGVEAGIGGRFLTEAGATDLERADLADG